MIYDIKELKERTARRCKHKNVRRQTDRQLDVTLIDLEGVVLHLDIEINRCFHRKIRTEM